MASIRRQTDCFEPTTCMRIYYLLSAALSACIDLSERQIVGPYYIAQDPEGSYKTLYYRLSDGLDAERVRNVYKVGYTADFIFVESKSGTYYINRTQDRPTDVGDPAVQQAIRGPLTPNDFRSFLDSIGEASFTFQYSAIWLST